MSEHESILVIHVETAQVDPFGSAWGVAPTTTESEKFDTRGWLFQRLAKQEVRKSSTSPGSKKYVLETLEVGADLSGHQLVRG